MVRYKNEMRERAKRMVAQVRPEHPHETATLRHVARLLGITTETLRQRMRREQIAPGRRPGTTTEDAEEIRRLRREVAELRRANEILKSASVSSARGDRRSHTEMIRYIDEHLGSVRGRGHADGAAGRWVEASVLQSVGSSPPAATAPRKDGRPRRGRSRTN